MRSLGIYTTDGNAHTRLRNQMKRLFNAHIQLAYEDEQVSASVNSPVTSWTKFWWNGSPPSEQAQWASTIELGEKFFHEIIRHPVPLDLNILKALGGLEVSEKNALRASEAMFIYRNLSSEGVFHDQTPGHSYS